ncbi:hypothetical protein FEI15_01295 [Lacticaseibacillus zeae]|uniref:Uncharacterized protein n=1 Tax=Lacticaseibacillus zeae TaxID=57037 RepID=A0A5R8LX57_LACZE|nr:hypothetical protein [Lacticaseibacillus zeae]TLF41874.1 hypothetical protein FEI15_01295 [Lacticaseibacillus zeae]
MVQMKEVWRNFLPKKYKAVANKQTTPQTFTAAMAGNGILALFLIVVNVFTSSDAIDEEWQFCIRVANVTMIGVLILDGFCWFLMRFTSSIKAQRFCAFIAIFSGGFISPALIIGILAMMNPEPIRVFLIGMGTALFIMVALLGCHLGLAAFALRKKDISLRDKYADIPINTVSILSIICLLPTRIIADHGSGIPFVMNLSAIIGIIYCLGIFQYPRVLRYWRQPAKPGAPEPVPHKNGIARIKKIR